MSLVWSLLVAMWLMPPQGLATGQFPDGWVVRVDGPAAADRATGASSAKDIAFVTMKPGWHITTGPAAILYNPTQTAAGRFHVTSETFLFDPGVRREAYGILIGGRNLAGADQAYTYFVIRRTGEFLIKRRSGAKTTTVKDWTSHPAIARYDEGKPDQRSVKNVLEVRVDRETTGFFVNTSEVARLPTSDIDTDGIVGLRVNHLLNIHVTSLDVSK